jgi:hypothetical protein
LEKLNDPFCINEILSRYTIIYKYTGSKINIVLIKIYNNVTALKLCIDIMILYRKKQWFDQLDFCFFILKRLLCLKAWKKNRYIFNHTVIIQFILGQSFFNKLARLNDLTTMSVRCTDSA